MLFCVCFGSWFTSNNVNSVLKLNPAKKCMSRKNRSGSESERWKEALYLCLLYIYVISSMFTEVIIKLVEWGGGGVDENECVYVLQKKIYRSRNRWCCISHKIHYYLPCERSKIRFDVNNKMGSHGRAIHYAILTLLHLLGASVCVVPSRSAERLNMEQNEQDCVEIWRGPRFIAFTVAIHAVYGCLPCVYVCVSMPSPIISIYSIDILCILYKFTTKAKI